MPAASRLLLSAIAVSALVLGNALPSFAAPASITPGRTTPPAGGTTAIGAGIDVLDDDAQLGERIPATVKAGWHAEPPICPATAGSDARRVAVTMTTAVVLDRGYQCSYVSAYAVGSGAVRWRVSYHFAYNLLVSGSTVYIAHDDPATSIARLDARSLSTGRLLWSTEDDDGSNEGNITVGGGLVVAGNTAIDQASGRTKFYLAGAASEPLDSGASLIWNGRILYNAPGAVRAYSLTGSVLWTYIKPTFGTNWQPQIHGSLLYLPDALYSSTTKMTVLNPATGKVVRRLPGSVAPIAFDGSVGITTLPVDGHNVLQQIRMIDLTTGKTLWTRVFPHSSAVNDEWSLTDSLDAPVIENGLVWAYVARDTLTPGQLIAYDEVTGVTRSTTVGACDESDGTITIAQGRIFTPSGCGVATYVAR